jgi:hypothetical protein
VQLYRPMCSLSNVANRNESVGVCTLLDADGVRWRAITGFRSPMTASLRCFQVRGIIIGQRQSLIPSSSSRTRPQGRRRTWPHPT